jgi:hypothetical protein
MFTARLLVDEKTTRRTDPFRREIGLRRNAFANAGLPYRPVCGSQIEAVRAADAVSARPWET